jgi:hypothetical protein
MRTAKIMRHRWKHYSEMNGDLKEVREETFFKIVFSNPHDMTAWENWIKERGGEYKYNKELSRQEGTLPDVKDLFGDEDICWCDVMTYYIMHVIHFDFTDLIQPYKGEVYTKV